MTAGRMTVRRRKVRNTVRTSTSQVKKAEEYHSEEQKPNTE